MKGYWWTESNDSIETVKAKLAEAGIDAIVTEKYRQKVCTIYVVVEDDISLFSDTDFPVTTARYDVDANNLTPYIIGDDIILR
jgi:hypothetical protein